MDLAIEQFQSIRDTVKASKTPLFGRIRQEINDLESNVNKLRSKYYELLSKRKIAPGDRAQFNHDFNVMVHNMGLDHNREIKNNVPVIVDKEPYKPNIEVA